jgi:hypothetical protein
MEIHDYIIIGSGCTGAMAAQTLIESGVKVLMLDVAIEDHKYKSLFPDKNYIDIRKKEENQYRYLLGEEFEGLTTNGIKTAAQLTPPRQHLIKKIETFLPLVSDTFFPMESLAYGGLGSAWGLGCCQFSEKEIEMAGLNYNEMTNAYQWVSDRIGISSQWDDISKYTIGKLENLQPPLKVDGNANGIYETYQRKKKRLNQRGFFMGRTALAAITQEMNGRKPYSFHDTDFYSDKEESAYRPWITINKLKGSSLFHLQKNAFVISFSEKENKIEVCYLNTESGERNIVFAKNLILACGTLGTARIVLRSFNAYDHKLPILCNPYSYIPCLQFRMLGKSLAKEISGFSQLSLFHDPKQDNLDVAMASIYSYRSLMLFRIAKEAPVNFYDGRIIINYLMPALSIMGIHHPESYSQGKYIQLRKNTDTVTGDELHAEYMLNEIEEMKGLNREREFKKVMRELGCWPIKRVDPGMGSSIHYAGCLPFSKKEKPFTLSRDGRLHSTKNVFVADGSGFTYLPAKGLTFSLFANAHYVAKNVLKT